MPKGNIPTEATVEGPVNLINQTTAPTATAGMVRLYADSTGELKAVQPSGGTVAIGTIASASETTIKAIAAADRFDGMVVVDKTNDQQWIFDSGSAASASAFVLVPDAGSGRWLRRTVNPNEIAVVVATPGAEAANAIEVACSLTDLAGAAITDQRKVLIRSHAVTPDQGDLAAAGTPVGTIDQAINPTTGVNSAIMTPTAGGLFTIKVTDTAAEKVLLEIIPHNGRPAALVLTFA